MVKDRSVDLANKRVLVVGLGKSGVAAALFLKARGARVTVSDAKPQEELGGEIPELLDRGIAIETGGHGERTFRGQDLIVVSPGVPVDSLQLAQAHALGETVIGEIELASRFLPRSIVAITGSNGKTTTTTLAGQIIAAGGLPVAVGGNIGTPAVSLVEQATAETVIVLEVSSFQLETIDKFRPKVAVVLNITPDHLDRHRTFAAYTDAKARIFENQQPEDFAVLNADDPTCAGLAGRTRAQVYWFSRKEEVRQGAFVAEGRILFRGPQGQREIMPLKEISLKGAHNVENVLDAVCTGLLMGCGAEQSCAGVRNFKPVEQQSSRKAHSTARINRTQVRISIFNFASEPFVAKGGGAMAAYENCWTTGTSLDVIRPDGPARIGETMPGRLTEQPSSNKVSGIRVAFGLPKHPPKRRRQRQRQRLERLRSALERN